MSAVELKGCAVVRSNGFFGVAPSMSLTSSGSYRPRIALSQLSRTAERNGSFAG